MSRYFLILFTTLSSFIFAQKHQSNYSIGNVLYEKYKFQSAAYFYKQHLETDSTHLRAWLKLGKCFAQLGNYQKAEASFSKGLEIDPFYAPIMNQQALLYVKLKDYAQAVESYLHLSYINPKNPYYIKKVASVYEKMGDVFCSTSYYQMALTMNEQDFETILKLADSYLNMGAHASADSMLILGMSIDSSNTNLLSLQVKSCFVQGNYQEAYDLLKKLPGDEIWQMRYLAYCAFELRKYAETKSILLSLEKDELGNENSAFLLGRTYLTLNKSDSALYYFEEAVNRGVSPNMNKYLLELALTYQNQEMHQKAIETFKKVKQTPLVLYHLARSYDEYYQDKSVALAFYQDFLKQEDSTRVEFLKFSKSRVRTIKKERHFNSPE